MKVQLLYIYLYMLQCSQAFRIEYKDLLSSYQQYGGFITTSESRKYANRTKGLKTSYNIWSIIVFVQHKSTYFVLFISKRTADCKCEHYYLTIHSILTLSFAM